MLLQDRAASMRAEGSDVMVEVVPKGLLAVQGEYCTHEKGQDNRTGWHGIYMSFYVLTIFL